MQLSTLYEGTPSEDAMKAYMQKQMEEALGADNRYYCSQYYGHEVSDPEVLLAYYIKHGGAKGFRERAVKTGQLPIQA